MQGMENQPDDIFGAAVPYVDFLRPLALCGNFFCVEKYIF
jgi:hypothetical protein